MVDGRKELARTINSSLGIWKFWKKKKSNFRTLWIDLLSLQVRSKNTTLRGNYKSWPGIFVRCFRPYFWNRVSHWTWGSLTGGLDWLAREVQGADAPVFVQWHLTWLLGIELRVSGCAAGTLCLDVSPQPVALCSSSYFSSVLFALVCQGLCMFQVQPQISKLPPPHSTWSLGSPPLRRILHVNISWQW